ncbi:uncharacterized protein LOC105777258 [Gossypium raimondii]|uniref:TLC domain-containing protein n=1 Tax=Gossypium raimondii TaxID=29730 RepID=A0A0D2RMC6_GOSRA|nr:uncharacterized protein LOC105777258 [Gossypium raimondii]XP_012455867.1 uncharacterized protein LOC105777258 [Gossypium raimondii]XP_052477504.1 uncharacterized protein LOC105777258 [Gossypium raimondii]KJB71821.1 hypothetical protein B456_011G142900 [Gossypium raimondii]KJB71822.1 hypothetical protein B456_011G142900 [Gossypium raimondii]
MAAVPKQTSMAIKSYKNQAQMLVKNYLLADPFAPYTSILGGILAFKVVYDLADLINNFYIKTYPSLTKIQRVDWNNRGISITHAISVSALSLYFIFWSDLFSDPHLMGLMVFRSSQLSTFGLGVFSAFGFVHKITTLEKTVGFQSGIYILNGDWCY